MLVISRKAQDSFTIGDNVKVHIIEVNGDRVKIGIEAPKNIIIMRSEVAETIKNNFESVAIGNIPNLNCLNQKLLHRE